MGFLFDRQDRSGWAPRRPAHRPIPTTSARLDLDLPEWMERGLCAQTDPEIFFPEKGGSTAGAKRVCQSCDVRSECLDYAIEHQERFGIWGGMSERDRRKLAKERAA